MEKLLQMAPNGALEFFYPTKPDLADILGRTDFDFENFHMFDVCGFQISRFLPTNLDFPTSKKLDFPASKNLDFPASKKSGFPGFQRIHTVAGGVVPSQ